MSTIISSEENRKLYAERKDQVLNLLETAKNYYLTDENPEKANIFSKLHEDLCNEEFSIVVVGEFSAGKSTLLNALMGTKILPSFSNETTATVNFLRHSEKSTSGEAGRVFYNNGTQEIITDTSIDTIMKYVSTKGDDVAKKVDHLDLYLDSDFLKDGVTLVDSPGLNGVADGHREITEAQILKSHASIFLFNSDHPGSKTDFEFLHELQSKVKTIIFVLNKIDEIKSDEGETPESVIETLKKTYKDKFPEEQSVPEIWPIAAYPALVARNSEPLDYHGKTNRTEEEKKKLEKASRLEMFEDRLMSFLTCGEKTKQQLLSPVERVLTLAQDTREDYAEEIKVLENSTDTTEVDNQIASIRESIDGIQNQMISSKKDVSRHIHESLGELREELAAQMSRLQKRKLDEIDEFDDLDELVGYLQSFEKSFIQRVYRIALTQEESLREKMIAVVRMQYAAQAGVIEERLASNNTEIKLSVSEHLDSSEHIFEVGLKGMDEKLKVLEAQLSKLQEEVNEAETNYYSAKAVERKREELKNEIRNLQDRKDTVEAQILPPIERYTEKVHTNKARGGLVGIIVDLCVGEKNVTDEKMREDSREYDAAKMRRDEMSSDIAQEIGSKKSELAGLSDVDSLRAEMMQIRKLGEIDAMRAKIESTMKENTQKIETQYNKEIKKIKRELTDYCDAITDDLNAQVKKTFRKSEQRYVEIILDIVEGTLRENLIEKQQRLEQLEKQLKSSEKDRNSRIIELNEKISSINVLIGIAADLQVDLANIPVDQIQRESI